MLGAWREQVWGMGNEVGGSSFVRKTMIAKVNFVLFRAGKTHKEKVPIP